MDDIPYGQNNNLRSGSGRPINPPPRFNDYTAGEGLSRLEDVNEESIEIWNRSRDQPIVRGGHNLQGLRPPTVCIERDRIDAVGLGTYIDRSAEERRTKANANLLANADNSTSNNNQSRTSPQGTKGQTVDSLLEAGKINLQYNPSVGRLNKLSTVRTSVLPEVVRNSRHEEIDQHSPRVMDNPPDNDTWANGGYEDRDPNSDPELWGKLIKYAPPNLVDIF